MKTNVYKILVSCDKCAELTRPQTPYRIQITRYTTDNDKPTNTGYYASVTSYNRLMRVLKSRGFTTNTALEKYGFASAEYWRRDQTITTYEKPSQAFNVIQYGFDPIITHVSIKNYNMRQTSKISVSSMNRIKRILAHSYSHLSDCGVYWFKSVYYI